MQFRLLRRVSGAIPATARRRDRPADSVRECAREPLTRRVVFSSGGRFRRVPTRL